MRADFKIKSEAGFTLTEVMVTVAIFGIVLTAVYAAFTSQFNSWQTQEDVVTVQTDIRSAAEMLTRDIRNAGFGVPIGTPGVTTIAVGSGANSISLNLAGTTTSTYVTSTNYQILSGSAPGPYTYLVSVASTSGFQATQTYNAIDIRTRTTEMGNAAGDKIIAVGTNTLTLKGTLNTNFVLNVGDLIVSPGYTTVTYQVSLCQGAIQLNRTDPASGTCVPLSKNVINLSDLAFLYTTDGTTWTAAPANLASIRAVKFTINGGTSNQISNLNGQKRTRSVNSIVALRNFFN